MVTCYRHEYEAREGKKDYNEKKLLKKMHVENWGSQK